MTYWQMIFTLSKANEADYLGDMLPSNRWQFPTSTWFQTRLEKIRKEQANGDN